ncbi:hypothetical protein IAR55_001942 [Kwoniella newhampshirensis]|uniref:USP domain-containing protein n=1 Tax=Kwoniella newhampshirensis TaxID=1651941 RepID=A0AAW0Z3J3_9TREE
MSRKKSKSSIVYPKELVLGNSVYDLRGVITHEGSSAHHGHFICETYDEKREALSDDFDRVNGAKLDMDRIVPRDAFAKFLQADSIANMKDPFDMSPILCQHGNIDPAKTSDARLVSEKAIDILISYASIPNLDICPKCVEDAFQQRLHQKRVDEQVTTFDSFDAILDPSGGEWIVPKLWLTRWKSGSLPTITVPTDTEYTLFCEHGKPIPNYAKLGTSISGEALGYLRSIIGDFDAFQADTVACEICLKDVLVDLDAEAAWRIDIKADKLIKRGLNPKPAAFDIDYFALSKRFVVQWHDYMKNPGPKPDLDMAFCEHGMLDYDPQMEKPDILEQSKWDMLCEK